MIDEAFLVCTVVYVSISITSMRFATDRIRFRKLRLTKLLVFSDNPSMLYSVYIYIFVAIEVLLLFLHLFKDDDLDSSLGIP